VAATAGPVALGVGVAALLALSRHGAPRTGGWPGAPLVEVLSPPVVDPEGAATLWTNLVALLRPAWPSACCSASRTSASSWWPPTRGSPSRLWVPGGIPPGLVAAGRRSRLARSRTETRAATPAAHRSPGVATGGSLTLAVGEQYMLRTGHKVDPIRPLSARVAALGEGETGCVQVLARPVTGRRLARLHKTATARRAGRPATRVARVLDLVTPGPATKPQPSTRPGQAMWPTSWTGSPALLGDRHPLRRCDHRTDRQAKARLRGRACRRDAFAPLLWAATASNATGLATRPGGSPSASSGRATSSRPRGSPPWHICRPTSRCQGSPSRRQRRAPTPAVPAAAGCDIRTPPGDRCTEGAREVARPSGRRPVSLAVPDARYHLHVMGATGSGKSTLLTQTSVLEDVEAGRGVCR